MRIGRVIGTVTLNRSHPSLLGASFKLAVPLSLEDLAGEKGDCPPTSAGAPHRAGLTQEGTVPFFRDADADKEKGDCPAEFLVSSFQFLERQGTKEGGRRPLTPPKPPAAETIVVYDDLGAGLGSRIAISEGREAAQPFHPAIKPVDAYNAAILDTIAMEDEESRQ